MKKRFDRFHNNGNARKLILVLIVAFLMLAVILFSFSDLSLSPAKFSLSKNYNELTKVVEQGDLPTGKGEIFRGGTPTFECVNGNLACNVASFLPPTFTGCYGDADGNGFVNAGDRGFVAANIGLEDSVLKCLYDMDGNGFINAADRGFIAANIGLCTPLPDFQDGSGLNHGAIDTRFGSCESCELDNVQIIARINGVQQDISSGILNVDEETEVEFSTTCAGGFENEWNFGACYGRGGWEDGSTASYKFSLPGTQTVTLKIKDVNGNELTTPRTLQVTIPQPDNSVPVVADFKVYKLIGTGRNGCYGTWEEVDDLINNEFELGERIKFSGVSSRGNFDTYDWNLMGGIENSGQTVPIGEKIVTFGTGEYDVQLTLNRGWNAVGRTTMRQVSCENLGGNYHLDVVQVASDNFDSGGWNGGTGWNGDWVHQGGDNAQVVVRFPGNYQLKLRGDDGYVVRRANVVGYESLRISFWGRTLSYETDDSSEFLISGDGVNWHLLKEFTSADVLDSSGNYNYYDLDLDLVALGVSDELWIAFDSNGDDSNDVLNIDYIVVSSGLYCTVNGEVVPVSGVRVGEGMSWIGYTNELDDAISPFAATIGDGDIYVLVWAYSDGEYQIRRFVAEGNIFETVIGGARPPPAVRLAVSWGWIAVARREAGLDLYCFSEDGVSLLVSNFSISQLVNQANEFLSGAGRPADVSATAVLGVAAVQRHLYVMTAGDSHL